MQTDYLSHDAEYQRRRAAGNFGWDDAASLQQTLTSLEEGLTLGHLGIEGCGRHMVEFGCGAGDLMLHMARRGWLVTGFDISPFALAWAREKAAAAGIAADFLQADLSHDLSCGTLPADLLLDGHCLHCIIGDHRAVFLRNAWKCLKPGGALLIHTMCGTPHSSGARARFDPVSRCIVQRGIALRHFGEPESILDELRAAGFKIAAQRITPPIDEHDERCLTAIAHRPSPG